MSDAQAPAARGPAAGRLRLGIAGFGVQGTTIAAALAAIQGVQITAVADVYATRLVRAKELLGESIVATRDYRALLDAVDAVIVATPDHLHASIAQHAMTAGKDVYVESPLAHSEAEAQSVVAAAASTGRICCCGSGRTGSALLMKAREIVASQRLGVVTSVCGRWGSSSAVEAWQTSFPPDASPDTIDYAAFLGAATRHEFDLKRFFRWRGYWDYGGGLAAARFAPMLTDANALLGLALPSRVAAGGGLLRWKDGRQTPDVLTAVLDYTGGPSVSLSATLTGAAMPRTIEVFGAEGTLVIEDRRLSVRSASGFESYGDIANTLPREYRDWYYMMHGLSNQGQVRAAADLAATTEEYDVPGGGAPPLTTELNDFVNAIRSRSAASAPLRFAADAAAAVDRINRAFRREQP